MLEKWKTLEFLGYPNYEVSSFGRIKSKARFVENRGIRWLEDRILKPNTSGKYPYVTLYNDKPRKYHYIHRLVALAFVPTEGDKTQINHIDGNKANNHFQNLEWCTSSENQIHAYETGLQKVVSGKKNPNNKPVIMMDKKGCEIKEFYSISSAASYINRSGAITAISNCCNGKSPHAYGYLWKFVKEVR